MPTIATTLTVVPVPGPGAEDVLVGPDGTVYTGTADGSVFAVSPDGDLIRRITSTGGRPLGLELLDADRLLVCDARRGLLAVDVEGGVVQVLADAVAGRPMRFCNNAAVLDDGTIWFTDSSTEWGIDEWKSDLIANTCTGRLLRLAPGESEPEVVLDGLSFANGVARTSDGSAVIVAETGHRRLRRVHLTGDRAGSDDVLVDDLPAHPDNIALGSDGLIWVTYASPADPTLAFLQTRATPWMRRLVLRAPEALKPAPKRTARAAAYDSHGQLVHDVTAPADAWHMATGVREHDGRVWLGSLVEPALAWFDLPGA
jgi:sugar lactone lactonase YvrE